MTEGDIRKQILKLSKGRRDLILWSTNSSQIGSYRMLPVGFPDLCGIYRGRWVGVEVKTSTGKQSDGQIEFERVVKVYGGIYILARSWEDVVKGLEDGKS